MTPVRGKRGRLIHLTHDLRRTLCDRTCDGWLIATEKETCLRCHEAATTN